MGKAKRKLHPVALPQEDKPAIVTTSDGGTITLQACHGRDGKAFEGVVTRGYKETPEERKARLKREQAQGSGLMDSKRQESRTSVKHKLKRKWL